MTETKELPAIKVTRNGVEKIFSEEIVGKKSKDNAGKHFPAPTLEFRAEVREIDGQKYLVFPVTSDLAWVGVEDVANIVQAKVRTESLKSWIDNIDETTGEPDVDAYVSEMSGEFGAGESLSDINDRIESMQAKQQELLLSDDAEADTETTMAKIKALALAIKPLKEKSEVISNKYQERAAKRKATKERKAAEAAAAKAEQALNQAAQAAA